MDGGNTDSTSYRDDPEAISLHTTPDDYVYNDATEINGLPPAYSDNQPRTNEENVPPATIPDSTIAHISPCRRTDHNSGYTMKNGKLQVYETQTLVDARYDNDPVYLEEGIRSFARQPPIPLLCIIGSHKETVKRGNKEQTEEVIDFRLVLNLQKYLGVNFDHRDQSRMELVTAENSEKAYRGTIIKRRAPGFKQDIEVGAPRPGLSEWCHRYCASPQMLRIFRLRRHVTGLDEDFLRKRIEGLIRSTKYRGCVNITFPVENKNVDWYTSCRINQWRLKTWVCWLFYLTFLWIFTWPYLFFATKRYAVVRAEWPFSKTDAYGNKQYTTLSEEKWFNKWRLGIRRLVLTRFQGEADEVVLTEVMAHPENTSVPQGLETIRTGHVGVDNAVGLLTQGIQVARAISRGPSLGGSSQDGWGYDM